MSYVRWDSRPQLRRPVLVAAFEGWNDAGEAATTALRWLHAATDAREFASVDPEEFYDFTVARPNVKLDAGMTRRIEWPAPTFSAATIEGGSRDVIFLVGIEPALKWRSFTESVLSVADALDVEMVFTMGALLADVPHTRPVRITGTATDPEIISRLGFTRSRYEGPTGILGVLMDACAHRGLKSASLWATTPHYLRETASPKAALALVERLNELIELRLDTTDLEIASAAYERQVNDMLEGEDDVVDYVRRLEEDDEDDADEEPFEIPSTDQLAEEVERFLRDQRGNS
ncbi:MAG TPA: PAC2 family protein [Acidimicrobiales bacterium]|jgi:proteasome assembly chaperone (PAC2) family protein|nr:PAC2 family protein [Acidimicrobiales bacterium]